jgi:hypothetical protein
VVAFPLLEHRGVGEHCSSWRRMPWPATLNRLPGTVASSTALGLEMSWPGSPPATAAGSRSMNLVDVIIVLIVEAGLCRLPATGPQTFCKAVTRRFGSDHEGAVHDRC